MSTIIYLVRHGKTEWNSASPEKVQTHSNGRGNMLTHEGYDQARRGAEILKDEKIDIAFCSPLLRTHETYAFIAKDHPGTAKRTDDRLTEMSRSFLDGMAKSEWGEQFPETTPILEARKADMYGCTMPEGDYSRCILRAKQIAAENGEPNKKFPPWENYSDVTRRVAPFAEKVTGLDKHVMISGHQGLNRSLLGILLAETDYIAGTQEVPYLVIPNRGVYRVEIRPEGTRLFHNVGQGWNEGLIRQDL
ncbi:hypothetical protein GF351_02070 [Candidatus Woesearchaeota archaeon]|nr:hypothetical protein [Candidatus Woesearchaeota archaeon]